MALDIKLGYNKSSEISVESKNNCKNRARKIYLNSFLDEQKYPGFNNKKRGRLKTSKI